MDYYNIEFLLWLDSLNIKQPAKEFAVQEELRVGFNRLFPVDKLRSITQTQYYSKSNKEESFCSWITSMSRPLSGGLFRLQNKCYGFDSGIARQNWRNRRNIHGFDPREDSVLQEEVLEPLYYFVLSKGEKCSSELKSIFPVPVLLNVLYLYWPNEFLPILSEQWLDKIIWQFSLGQCEELACKAREVLGFYRRISGKHEIYPLGFVRLMDAYLGLSNWGDADFGQYLSDNGLDEDSAEKCRRTLRMWYSFKCSFTARPSQYAKSLKSVTFISELEQYVRTHQVDSMLGFDVRFGSETALKLLGHFHSDFDGRCYARKQPRIVVPTAKVFSGANNVDELVERLCECGENHDSYMHYTTLTGLLHIVGHDSKQEASMRLTRGDDEHMNDQLEWKRLGQEDVWKRTFLMCFQADENECAAMWGLYGKPDNEAVRIMFPHDILIDWIKRARNGGEKVYYREGDCPKGRIVTLPIGSYDISLADVLYGGNVTGEKPIEKPQYVVGGNYVALPRGINKLEKSKTITGYIKSIDWSYEKETRIIVKIKDDNFANQLLDVKHIYIGCEQLPFELLTYMFGPCVPEKLYEVYEQTLTNRLLGLSREYVKKSNYTGFLKFK